MTESERQELEEWAAKEIMGWVEIIPQAHTPMVYYGIASDDPPICSCIVAKANWHPITDLNQCFKLFVPRMRELGWWLFWNNEENVAEFYQQDSDRIERVKDDSIGDAIILAAKATGVK